MSIVGDTKSGKSFLMNNLVGLDNNRFEVESGKFPKPSIVTFLWSIPLFIPHEEKYIFFIDTQGLEKNEQNENKVGQKIFTIITLLSSYLLFNMLGDLNEHTLKRLYLIATLPASVTNNALNTENDNNEEKISKFCPKFMLLLRDVEKDISKLIKTTAKENMESLINNFSKTKNELTLKIKKNLVGLFKERDCIAFPKPFPQSNHNSDQMNFDFSNGLLTLRSKLEKNVEEKIMFNIFLNSRMICSLLQSFIDIENQNGIIDLNIS